MRRNQRRGTGIGEEKEEDEKRMRSKNNQR